MENEKRKLRLGADVVVSTPGRLLQLLETQKVDLSQLSVMVLDEADVLLMDESFPLQPIGQACGSASGKSSKKSSSKANIGDAQSNPVPATPTQFLFVTATLPDIVVRQIKSEFPEVMALSGPGLHRIAPNIEEVLVDCSGPLNQPRTREQTFTNKRNALIKALDGSSSAESAERTIIFCNTIEQCRRVENILQREDRHGRQRSVYSHHSAVDPAVREENLANFSKHLLQQPAVLICTDRASRGMDFNKAHVSVVMFLL